MRNLELYVDSKLKQFNLYKNMEQILREGSTEVDSDMSIDEVQSLALFKEFTDLATLLDNYGNWSDSQWTNFLTNMMIAFKEKGKASSINCALAALGITSKPATLENSEDGFTTYLSVEIIKLDTPNVSNFLERLKELLPKLIWTHELDTSEVIVDQANVKIYLSEQYTKTMFDRAVRYSIPVSTVSSSTWGV